jgi:hypothetical protein
VLDLLLAEGSGTATSLGNRLPVTRQAVAKHSADEVDSSLEGQPPVS